MSKNWKDNASFERFSLDKGIKKKQKRGDRKANRQRLRDITSDIDRFGDYPFREDSDGRQHTHKR